VAGEVTGQPHAVIAGIDMARELWDPCREAGAAEAGVTMRTWLVAGAALAASCFAGPAFAQETCGGLQGLQCSAGEYCYFTQEALCGAADQTGTCQPRPEFCTEQYDPVCGCDDQTYPNACYAAKAGVSVAQAGQCGASAEPVE